MDLMSRIQSALESQLLRAHGPTAPPRLLAAMRHAVFPGGARIRPQLCLAVARACAGTKAAVRSPLPTSSSKARCTSSGTCFEMSMVVSVVWLMRYVSGLAQHTTMTTPLPHLAPEQLLRLVTVQMPYGKYKGRVIADLPGHYLNWFAREGFPAGDLGRLLALMQTIDHNGLKGLLLPLRGQTLSQRPIHIKPL